MDIRLASNYRRCIRTLPGWMQGGFRLLKERRAPGYSASGTFGIVYLASQIGAFLGGWVGG